ncbi:MAG: 2-oxo acid dehydrogenase subunit E2 [Bacteroidota bacterium]
MSIEVVMPKMGESIQEGKILRWVKNVGDKVERELDGEDVVVVRSMVYLSITYDHRVIDGALATQALAAMVRALESINEGNTAL